jgi:hypothetical protein
MARVDPHTGCAALSAKASFNAGLLPGTSADFDKSFVDSIFAARATLALAERWSVNGYLDIGGLGISSKVTWQLFGTLNYRVADWVDLRVGYRHLAVERDKIEASLTGPIIGATFRF